jgi:ABC-type transport system substrate-binding protein
MKPTKRRMQKMQTQTETTESSKPRTVSQIAREIQQDWSKIGKGINYAAKPYLSAMLQMQSVTENYGYDSGSSVVLYFLANAQTYRGEKAKALKAELKQLLKAAGHKV